MSEDSISVSFKNSHRRQIYLYSPLLLVGCILMVFLKSLLPMEIFLMVIATEGIFHGINMLKLSRVRQMKGKNDGKFMRNMAVTFISAMVFLIVSMIYAIVSFPLKLY